MSKSCCVKPIAKIIKVGTFDAGIIGLEAVLKNICTSGVKDEEQIKTELLRLVKEYGNYIASGTESEYENALFCVYQKYIKRIQVEQNI
jgi:hypothetical protein